MGAFDFYLTRLTVYSFCCYDYSAMVGYHFRRLTTNATGTGQPFAYYRC